MYSSSFGDFIGFLITIGLIGGVVALIINASRKDKEIKGSPLYAEWYWYYVDNGYPTQSAIEYAKTQTKKGLSLADFNTKMRVNKDGTRSYISNDDSGEDKSIKASANSQPAGRPAPQKPKADAGQSMTNFILGVAGFLLSGSLIIMVNDMAASLVAPIFITIVLIFYFAGTALYRSVKHLKPVGVTFMVTALVLVPFCSISFADIFKDVQLCGAISAALTSLMALCLYAYAAFITNHKLLGSISYLCVFAFIWSLADFFGLDQMPGLLYWILLTPFLISIPCAIIWTKHIKIPVCFRVGCKVASYVSIVVGLVSTVFLMLIPYSREDFGFLRTLIALLSLIQFSLIWINTKKFADLVWVRFLGQLTVLMLTADCLAYSIVVVGHDSGKTMATMVMSIVWAASFFIQSIVSLFIKHKAENKKGEEVISAVSLFGIASTFIVAASLSKPEVGIIDTTVFGLIAALGIFYSVAKKNSLWGIATAISLVAIPLAITSGIVELDNNLLIVLFSILSLLAAAVFALLKSIDDKNQLAAPLVLLTCSAVFALGIGAVENVAGYAVWPQAIAFLVIAALYRGKDSRVLREAAIYTTAWAGVLFLDTFMHEVGGCRTQPLTCSDALLDLQKFIQAHIIGGAFILSSYLYDKKAKDSPRVRLIWGYLAYSFGGALIAIFARTSSNNLTYGLIYLLEQAAILAFAATVQIKWLAVSSGIALVLGGLYISGLYENTYVWMMGIGMLLVGVAVWRLTATKKSGDKPADGGAPKAPEPVAPAIAEDEKTEEKAAEDSDEKTDDEKPSDDESKEDEEAESKHEDEAEKSDNESAEDAKKSDEE